VVASKLEEGVRVLLVEAMPQCSSINGAFL